MEDLLLDNDGDLRIGNGDFVLGESSQQEIELLLTSFRGEWKLYPKRGIEIQRMLKARQGIVSIKGVVQEQMEMDGFVNVDFDINNNGELEINAERI